MKNTRIRRAITVVIVALIVAFSASQLDMPPPEVPLAQQSTSTQEARTLLAELTVKGRAPKTGYDRTQFGGDWETQMGCDMRNRILRRDLTNVRLDETCRVVSGLLDDPYTGKPITFQRGTTTSADIQVDHVVALSNSWQTGAQQLSFHRRVEFANDPLNLLAVDGSANQQKSDGDAATWLPPHKPFRCQYVSRQVQIKAKYALWLTPPEKEAISNVLRRCR